MMMTPNHSWQTVEHMVLTLLRRLTFVWACIASAAMIYFALQWFPDFADLPKNEMAMGFAIAAAYGFPAFVALTLLAFANWSEPRRTTRLVLLAPVALCLTLWTAARWFSAP